MRYSKRKKAANRKKSHKRQRGGDVPDDYYIPVPGGIFANSEVPDVDNKSTVNYINTALQGVLNSHGWESAGVGVFMGNMAFEDVSVIGDGIGRYALREWTGQAMTPINPVSILTEFVTKGITLAPTFPDRAYLGFAVANNFITNDASGLYMAYVNLDPYAEPSWRTKIDTTNSPGVVPNTFAVYGYIPPGYIATLGPDNVGAVIGDPNNPNTWIYKGTLGDLMGGPPAGSNNGKASKNDAPRAKTVALSPSNSSQLEKLATVPDVIRYLTGNGAILNLGCSYYSSVKTNANIYRYEQVDANTIVNLLATSFLTKPDTYLGIKVSDVDSSKADIYMATGDITIQEDTSSTCDPDLYVFQSKPYAPPANNGAPLGNTGAPLANTGAPLANTDAPLANTGAPLDVVQQFLLENPNIGNLFAGITKIGCMPIPVPMADFQIPIDVINTEGLSPNLIQPGSYIGLNFNESTNTLEIKTQPLGSYAPEFNPLDDLITTLPMTQCSASTYTVYKNIPNGSTPSGGRVSRRAQKKRRSTKKNRKAKRMTRKMRKVRRSTKSRK